MSAYEEFYFGNDYILRFYRSDQGLVCSITESMVAELRAVEAKIKQQQTEIEALKKELYFKDYYEELPDTPVDLLRKVQEK